MSNRAVRGPNGCAIHSASGLSFAFGRRQLSIPPPHQLHFRPAGPADSDDLLEWRNDPATVAASLNAHPVARPEHEQWFRRSLAEPARRIVVAELEDGSKVGMVRYDRTGEGVIASINLNPHMRGRGLAAKVLLGSEERLRDWVPLVLVAEIRAANEASRRAFAASGYVDAGPSDGASDVRKFVKRLG